MCECDSSLFVITFICSSFLFSAIYYQITRFIQGYVDNEINLNPDESCKRTCSDYSRTQSYGCHPDTLCGQTHIDPVSSRCNGTVYDCDFVDEDLTACAVIWLNMIRLKVNRLIDALYFSQHKNWTRADMSSSVM